MNKRSRVRAYGSAGLLVLAGIAAVIGFSGTLGQVLAIALIGGGVVAAVALVFYEVGLSEDRERAREEAAAKARASRLPERGRPRFRLGRARGQRRRLG